MQSLARELCCMKSPQQISRKGFIKRSGSLLLSVSLSGPNFKENNMTIVKSLLKQPVCKVCGTQYPSGNSLPDLCTICNDDRQYITEQGQLWLEIEELKQQYSTKITKITDQLYSLKISPDFGIGQRAFLVGEIPY